VYPPIGESFRKAAEVPKVGVEPVYQLGSVSLLNTCNSHIGGIRTPPSEGFEVG
jgi:hypothetical protein